MGESENQQKSPKLIYADVSEKARQRRLRKMAEEALAQDTSLLSPEDRELRETMIKDWMEERRRTVIQSVQLPGQHDFEISWEGQKELVTREILAYTYQPGDILRVSYVFHVPPENPDIPNGARVKFVGWEERVFEDQRQDSYLYWTGEDPGVFRVYSWLVVDHKGELKKLYYRHAILDDESLIIERLKAGSKSGDKEISKYVRIGNLPEEGSTEKAGSDASL